MYEFNVQDYANTGKVNDIWLELYEVELISRILLPSFIQYGSSNNNTATPEPARVTWSQRAHYPCDSGQCAIYILGTAPPRNRSRFEQE
uniref:Uncharacterized protein n=1 Tax=Panagrolaimus sp. ES5 TaxID=591445 RepID=A0AC34G5K4_9BILA